MVKDRVNLGSLEGSGSNYSKGLIWFIVRSQVFSQPPSFGHVPRPPAEGAVSSHAKNSCSYSNGRPVKALPDTGISYPNPSLNIKIVSLGKLVYVHFLQCVHSDLKSYPATDVTFCIEDQAPLLRVGVAQHLHDIRILQEMSLCLVKSSVIQKANLSFLFRLFVAHSQLLHIDKQTGKAWTLKWTVPSSMEDTKVPVK